MRRTLKFLHTASAIGLAGGLAAYMIVLATAPDISSLAEYAALRASVAAVSQWLIVPSMAVVLVSGLLAMAVHSPFHDAPWVWIKGLSGILVFEATLGSIDAPAKRAAKVTGEALAGQREAAAVAELVNDEWVALWVVLGLAAANVALAIWRPQFRRFLKTPDTSR